MKKWIRDNLPLSLKLLLKRLFIGLVRFVVRLTGSVVNFVDRVLDIAIRNGLDINRAWKVRPRPMAVPVQLWNSHDFLFIMNAISGKESSARSSDGPIQTSIIIPVFNKVEYTFQCLRSLMREINFNHTEVIVVNNASTDETGELLSHFRELVRVISNEENKGFVDACNQGAAVARGKYLVFLNNDTVVLSGWLKHMLDTIESDPTAGAVGSMFLYPNGIIQEAGAIIWKNGDPFHYGWGQSPSDKRYNFAREVDYCSAASLLIKKDIFDRLGGFDHRYAPAYFEDIDLCFGVRSLGYKVIYQPMSRIIHHEGITAGRDTQVGYKHFQIVNQEKFVAKWREELIRDQCEKDLALLERAANRKRGPRIIIFDDRIPTPDRDAGSARMMLILQTLAKWSRPVFVYLSKPFLEYEQLLWKEGIETVSAVDYRRLIKKNRFSVAILSRPEVADIFLRRLRRADSEIKIIFDMVDAYFIRLEREHIITNNNKLAEEAARYRKLEMRLARLSDQVWCNSSEDKKMIAQEITADRIEVIETFHPLHDRGKSFDERQGLLFIGNLHHRPNSDAVRYLLKELYPLIQKSMAGIKLYIVGPHDSPEIAAYSSDDVHVTGYVPDVEPFFQGTRLLVAPLRFGAGVKGKIGDALSYGLPVVTTSVGAEGIGLRHGEDAMIVDDPQGFADAVVQVYCQREMWQRLADNGYKHIEKHYTPQVLNEKINAIMKGVIT